MSEMDKKVAAAKKRVGNVKGKDLPKKPKAKISPVATPSKVGFRYTQKFSKGGMAAKKKGC